jgi:hypothetical protein
LENRVANGRNPARKILDKKSQNMEYMARGGTVQPRFSGENDRPE